MIEKIKIKKNSIYKKIYVVQTGEKYSQIYNFIKSNNIFDNIILFNKNILFINLSKKQYKEMLNNHFNISHSKIVIIDNINKTLNEL